MRKIFLSISTGFLLLAPSVMAQSISAGYGVTSTVCANGKVYTWGNNSSGGASPVLGILGTGSTASTVPSPMVVQFPIPGGGSFKQVSSKGGTHFLALDCEGHVWSWGNNANGQLGTGGVSPAATVPAPVKFGSGPMGNVMTNSGTVPGLSEVAAVHAAMFNSFALLKDGRLLSWGANSQGAIDPYSAPTGMLGDGTTTDKTSPVFVRNGQTGAPLANVLQVQASDGVAYALVDDGTGTGMGTVYSWGNGQSGSLGRNATGTANPANTANVQSSMAYPVIKADGTPLNGIVSISAGGVFCLALDVQGYVWAWGLGSWGGNTGQGIAIAHSDPRKVVKGAVTGTGTDGTYLLAKSIGAGQSFAAAVTADGKPVAWGNNGGATFGGYLGNGSAATTAIPSPAYIIHTANSTHSDVLSVFQGVLNGYYLRADGSLWTWGENSFGELGLGNNTDQLRATAFTAPCTMQDPKPTAKLNLTDTIVCESGLSSSNIVLKADVGLSSVLAANYIISWYKDGVLLPDSRGTITVKGSSWRVSLAGTYKVKIEYQGSSAPCGGYDADSAEATIRAYPRTFQAPSDLTYCNNKAIVHVEQLPAAANTAQYNWYNVPAGTTLLGTSLGNANTELNVSSIPANSAQKMVYVEEKISAKGSAVVTPPTAFMEESAQLVASAQGNDMLIRVFDDIVIDTISIAAKTFQLNPQQATFQFKLYGQKNTCNGIAANRASTYASGTISTITVAPNTFSTIKIPVGIRLKGSQQFGSFFFIGLSSNLEGSIKKFTGVTQFNYPNNMIANNLPLTDNVGGQTLHVLGTDQADCIPNPGTYGSFFDWKFSVGQKYCDRVPVVLTACLSTENEEENKTPTFPAISPNPFKEQLLLNTAGYEKVMVYHVNGSLLEERTLSNEPSLQLGQQWAKGVYVLQLLGKEANRMLRAIKE